jgi:hypothetical protein
MNQFNADAFLSGLNKLQALQMVLQTLRIGHGGGEMLEAGTYEQVRNIVREAHEMCGR